MSILKKLISPPFKPLLCHQANLSQKNIASRCLASLNDSTKEESSHAGSWKLELKSVNSRVMEEFALTLNDVPIRTPMKKPLKLPNELFGQVILSEWKARENMEKRVDHGTMHLTTLAYEAIDNPFRENRLTLTNQIIEYLKFDCIRYREIQNEEFVALQSRHWDPLVGWFEDHYQCQLPIVYGQLAGHTRLPGQTIETIRDILMGHSFWSLVGAKFMVQNLKSFVLTSCLMTKFLEADQAVDISRLETGFQTQKWSKIESEHDMEEQSIRARVAAGSIFYHLSNDADR